MGRRTRHLPFTEEQINFVLENYLSMTVMEMNIVLGKVGERRIYRLMDERGLKSLEKRKRMIKKVAEGMFNEREFDNWLA